MARLLITVALIFLATSFVVGVLSSKSTSNIQKKDRGSLSWYADVAKEKGQREVIIPAPVVSYAVPRSFEEALAYYSLVVVEPLDHKTHFDNWSVTTWYKFRLIEELSIPTETCTYCANIGEAPSDMLPLQNHEFVTSKSGGEVAIDGIRILSSDTDFPVFKKGKRYLLFVSFDTQKTVAAMRMGPWGAFTMDENDRLKAVNEKFQHPVRDELTSGVDNSLNRLRNRLNRVKS
ncbi:MAG TPA: hypothetical protein VNO50_02165 [Pyrinomonadaceae bacterium]|nr:hypothetical protein [Pyrinomonadaceae bacterium]